MRKTITGSKNSNGTLNIGEKIVSIVGKHNFVGFQIAYDGDIELTNLLNNNWILRKGNGTILIVSLNGNKGIDITNKRLDLFLYYGNALITHCFGVTQDLENYNITIDKKSIQTWGNLSAPFGSKEEGSYPNKATWESLTINWEELDFDGRNNKHKYIKSTVIRDKESKTITSEKEIRNR